MSTEEKREEKKEEEKKEEEKKEEGKKEEGKKEEGKREEGKREAKKPPPKGKGEGKGEGKGGKSAKNTWLKTPKGTRDYEPKQMKIREKAIGKLVAIFKRHGAVTIETPLFELKETLMGKYGEDSKLIFDLADQGGELCSLRYDLTVPFARYVASHSVENMKRYHIGRVYRRDNPVMTKGRFREFYQCDFDIAGVYDSMIPEAEVFRVMSECLLSVDVGKFVVKVNHRLILDGIFEVCGVPKEMFRPICSAVDKLDKMEWAEVKKEMVDIKHLDPAIADKLGNYVLKKGEPWALLEELEKTAELSANESIAKEEREKIERALKEMRRLFGYLEAYDVLQHLSFDLSLARGLDYYTGVIYEAVLVGADVGSVAAGGRYDHLVGIFGSKDIPAVGFSVGIERIFSILEKKYENDLHIAPTQVLVASFDANMVEDRMRVLKELWGGGISSEIVMKENVKIQPQLKYASQRAIPIVVFVGKEGIEKGQVEVKVMSTGKQETVSRAEMTSYIHSLLPSICPPSP